VDGCPVRPSPILVEDLVRRALAEDIGAGDLTSGAVVPEGHRSRAAVVARERGVIAGLDCAEMAFRALDPGSEFERVLDDGREASPGSVVARVSGETRPLLAAERVALNFLQRLSGIATKTARCVAMLEGARTTLLDTRKTTPGLRALEKYAVRVGGGCNHRMGLFDAVLVKDNHIRVVGGVREALERVRRSVGPTVTVEVEVEDLDGLLEALEAGADVVMLDNADEELVRKAVEAARGRAPLEVSGGVREEDLPRLAALGVEYVSMGALTHSARALDLSMEIVD